MEKNKKAKVLFVIEDNLFHVSEFIDGFLKRKSKNYFISDVFLVKKIKKEQNINRFMLDSFFKLEVSEITKFIFYIVLRLFQRFFYPSKYNPEIIIKKYNIKVKKISYKLSNYQKFIKSIDPDIIVNSSSLYFTKDIIHNQKFKCINRHSSLLPAGGGFFPIFYALAYNEPLGTTVHYMVDRIDQGEVIIQKRILKLENYNSLFELYKKSFNDSIELIPKAIDIILKRKKHIKLKNIFASYRSFPKENDWKAFRKKKVKWI